MSSSMATHTHPALQAFRMIRKLADVDKQWIQLTKTDEKKKKVVEQIKAALDYDIELWGDIRTCHPIMLLMGKRYCTTVSRRYTAKLFPKETSVEAADEDVSDMGSVFGGDDTIVLSSGSEVDKEPPKKKLKTNHLPQTENDADRNKGNSSAIAGLSNDNISGNANSSKSVTLRPADTTKKIMTFNVRHSNEVKPTAVELVAAYNSLPSMDELEVLDTPARGVEEVGGVHGGWCAQCDMYFAVDEFTGVVLCFRTMCGGPFKRSEQDGWSCGPCLAENRVCEFHTSMEWEMNRLENLGVNEQNAEQYYSRKYQKSVWLVDGTGAMKRSVGELWYSKGLEIASRKPLSGVREPIATITEEKMDVDEDDTAKKNDTNLRAATDAQGLVSTRDLQRPSGRLNFILDSMTQVNQLREALNKAQPNMHGLSHDEMDKVVKDMEKLVSTELKMYLNSS
ncbi:hypothetical protein CALCODRAFT_506557 [Calocera cornea HHB12733]|uniref:Uncharacterized protein n=1 Tax=Calocera cornea HHB12733 TaxID=1353952 RepID=A0A165ISL5_9BASI|nr:hypothetical protein CALCODRAFT_506557 [Calocera cornea HHB12733]